MELLDGRLLLLKARLQLLDLCLQLFNPCRLPADDLMTGRYIVR